MDSHLIAESFRIRKISAVIESYKFPNAASNKDSDILYIMIIR